MASEAEGQSDGRRSERGKLLSQSFLTSLPIVLTVGLGFLANSWQSSQQHDEQMRIAEVQAQLDREKQAFTARQAELGRRGEAERAFGIQEREAEAKLDQQAREFAANAQMNASRFAQEQATLRRQHSAQQSQQGREFEQSLERQRRQTEADLLLQVIKVGDLNVARTNIDFLLQAGLVRDPDGRIAQAARQAPPVLPTASGALTEAVGFEQTGALPSFEAEAGGGQTGAAARLLNCAIDEYNKNVREGGGEQQIRTYLQALGFPPDASIAWSGAFIGYCLKATGADSQIRPSAMNRAMMEAAQRSGIWMAAGADSRPAPGDIYFIARATGSSMHTGVIRRVDGTSFEGLEGNLGDRISLVPRSLATPGLAGFARLRDR
jgi:hypothetical protein